MDHSNMDHMGHMEHMGHMGHEGMDHSQHTVMDPSQHAGHEAMQHNIVVHDPSHAGMNHSMHSMMMSMTFHTGSKEKILFECWDIDSVTGLLASFIAIFIVAMLYEGLKYYRKHLLWKAYQGLQYCAVAAPDKPATNQEDHHVIQPIGGIIERKTPRMMSQSHAFQTLLHALQVLVSYMLMLVFMTYNVWLCLAVVLGAAAGYFLFGWRESVVVDFTEHCH